MVNLIEDAVTHPRYDESNIITDDTKLRTYIESEYPAVFYYDVHVEIRT